MKKADLLLAGGALLLAAALYLVLRPGGTGAWVVVTVDGAETARYALDGERTVTIGGADWNVLEIADGEASVLDANCGDHTCVNMGAISREGESIVCLPHKLTIHIEGGMAAPLDAIAG